MEIKITTSHVLKVLQVFSWIIFIGLCVQAGAVIGNAVYTFAINPANTFNFWEGANLSGLYQFDQGHFMVIMILMAIVAVLKAILFYLIIRLFLNKQLNMSQPFSAALRRFIVLAGYLALGIGLFSHWGSQYAKWLISQKVAMPDAQALQIAGADVWFFMAVILFVVSQIVRRGIEIQTENDLTI